MDRIRNYHKIQKLLLEEAIQKGAMKKAIEAANLLRHGVSKEIVAKETELPIGKIEEIQKQLEKEYLH